MKPTSMKQTSKETLEVRWDDGHLSSFPIAALREACPCASCKGETILFETYAPPKQVVAPGRFDLKAIRPVGSYAAQFVWGDGHETGLYSWEYLRGICPCEQCTAKRRRA